MLGQTRQQLAVTRHEHLDGHHAHIMQGFSDPAGDSYRLGSLRGVDRRGRDRFG